MLRDIVMCIMSVVGGLVLFGLIPAVLLMDNENGDD
jgi:hypothetical protein